jgi:tetratricopeptide (TPR) repeat protein
MATPTSSRRWLWLAATAGVLVLVAAIWWSRQDRTAPPDVPPVEDAEVAEAMHRERGRVLREPTSAEAWERFGMTLLANDCAPQAVECFRRCARLDAGDYRWPFLVASLLQTEAPEAALREWREAARRAPRDMLVALALADAEFVLGNHTQAEQAWRLVLDSQVQQAHPHAKVGLARLALQRNQFDEARDLLLACQRETAVRKNIELLLAELDNRKGDTAQAMARLQNAQAMPDDPPRPEPLRDEVGKHVAGLKSYLVRGDQLRDSGSLEEALRLLNEGARKYPNAPWLHLSLGKTWALVTPAAEGDKLGETFARGREALQKSVELAPGDALMRFYLGAFLHDKGRRQEWADAAAQLRKAVELQPDHVLALRMLGDVLLDLGERSEAVATLRKAAQLRPEHVPTRAKLGAALLQAGGVFEAWPHLAWANRASPQDPSIQRDLLLAGAILALH